DFWNGWWIHGRYMSASTGRSLANQLGLGWHSFYLYTRDHMPATLAIVGFIGLGIARWRLLTRRQRALHVLLVAWWVAAWLEIILTQRYSSHYFAVTALPTALMIAGCSVHLVALLSRAGQPIRRRAFLPHLLIAVSLYWSGTATLNHGLAAAEKFPGIHGLADQRSRARDGYSRAVQGLLELTSRRDDPVQIWTSRPWWYLNFRRVSATRFIWKSFLMGETYLGRTSPDYILPGSWDDWAADFAQADPQVFIVDNDFPMPGNTPADVVLAERFAPLMSTPKLDVSATRAVIDRLVSTVGMSPNEGTAESSSVDTVEQVSVLGMLPCRRIDLRASAGEPLRLLFAPTADAQNVDEVVFADGQVITKSPFVEYMRTDAIVSGPIRVVIGTSSALVIVGDRVVAGLAYLDRPALTVVSRGSVTAATGEYSAPGECERQ
ncbi:MAG TPA: hypothetical protein PKV27_02575, partial [Ilumatobacteraceae bacterium]|nr:hypothetical protein [Ilumatobacteraceae bacterium]